MSIIIPAVLPKSREDLESSLSRLALIERVETVQIDVVDGHFARPATWPYAGSALWELPRSERFRFDLDLMVTDPGEAVDQWVALGATRVTLHAESVTNLPHLVASFEKKYGHEAGFTPALLSLGLAFGIETDLAAIEPYVQKVDYIQFMGIAHIGRQGEPFDRRVLLKIRSFRARHPNIVIQVDGGVSLHTASDLFAAGADRLIVGSALMKADNIEAEITKFEALGEKYGMYER